MGTGVLSCASVAVLCDNRDMYTEEIKKFYESQIEFNYLPVSFFDHCKDQDDDLQILGHTYNYVFRDYGFVTCAKQIQSAAEVEKHEIMLEPGCQNLRVTHFIKEHHECLFLVNEGEDAINAKAHINGTGCLAGYDLWNDNIYLIPTSQEKGNLYFDLVLKRRESLLLILLTKSEQKEIQLTEQRSKEYIEIPEFIMTNENPDMLQKTYEATFSCDAVDENTNVMLTINANEMVEYFVNGAFAGVTMWNPHEINIMPYLNKGKNLIKLVVTGNLANKFSNTPIPYGINVR